MPAEVVSAPLISAGGAFSLTTDGTTVTGRDASGLIVSSSVSADAGAALTALLPAVNSAGRSIRYGDGTFTQTTTPALPSGITGQLVIGGTGATLLATTTGARRFLDFNRTGDGLTFQNIKVFGFVVDAASFTGSHHVVLGTYTNGGWTTTGQRCSFLNVAVEDIRVINGPSADRRAVAIVVSQLDPSEGTQNSIQNVAVRRVTVDGCYYGVQIAGTLTNSHGAGMNCFIDNVLIEDCRHNAIDPGAPVGNGANFFIGSEAFGGKWTIRRCWGRFSNDVGLETDAGTQVLVEDCYIENAYAANYYCTLFNYPAVGGGAAPSSSNTTWPGSRTIYRNCRAAMTGIDSFFPGWKIAGSGSPWALLPRRVELIGCSYYRSRAATTGGDGIAILRQDGANPAASTNTTLVLDDFHVTDDGATYSGAGGITQRWIYIEPRTNVKQYLRIRGLRWYTNLVRSGAGTIQYECVSVNSRSGGTATIYLDVDDSEFELTCTGGSAGMFRLFTIGLNAGTTIGGGIKRTRLLPVTGDTAPIVCQFFSDTNVTYKAPFRLDETDLTQAPAGTVLAAFISPRVVGKAAVFTSGTKWPTFPTPSQAVAVITSSGGNFAAATFTTATGNQYLGGFSALFQLAAGTGAAFTKLELSKDGVTYEEVYTQASGALAQDVIVPIDNGDFVRPTFATTMPTGRILPVK